jgi:hypothetical protein
MGWICLSRAARARKKTWSVPYNIVAEPENSGSGRIAAEIFIALLVLQIYQKTVTHLSGIVGGCVSHNPMIIL